MSAFALLWPLALYPAALWVFSRMRPRNGGRPVSDSGALPSITVIVPTYNEISNIRARLENISACCYPKELLHVLVVDSASGDGTADIADAYAVAAPDLQLRVLREGKRGGKAKATNLALEHCMTDLVLVTDAPTRFDPLALEAIARSFQDPDVGAATGRFVIFEQRTATQREEGLFWHIRNLLRNLEADVDSTPFLSGEFCCFRRELIRAIDTDSIADDMNAALQVRRQGFRAIVEPTALFTEPRSEEVRDLLVRKVSRAAGGVQELLRHRDMMFQPRYGLFGMFILPSDLLYYVPVRIPALVVLASGLIPLFRRHKWPLAAGALAALAVAPLRRRLMDAVYVALLNEWLFVRGWQTVLAKRTEVLWEQEKRNVVPAAGWRGGEASTSRNAGVRK
ncbi:MAG: glycosyltransferase [Chloroflexi bacterium]|nr:glycosyltransferase [Chloroflexota bacterium]